MRLGIEVIAAGSALEEGSGGGPGYFHALIPRIRDDPRVEHLFIFAPTWYERADEWANDKGTVVRCRVPKTRPLRVAYEQALLPVHARRSRLHALLSPSNYRPLAYRGRNVVVLHAIQHFLLNDDIGRLRSSYLRFAVPRSIRTADRTIAVTETLRRDAIELFGLDPEKIVTVRMGPQPWVLDQVDARADVEPYPRPGGVPYVMCISRLYALKNHARLIRGYAKLVRDRGIPHQLLIVGGDGELTREDLAAVAASAGVGDRVVFLGRVPQSEVRPLYAGAEAVAYVSLYETFGHPVLEAFAMGKPLLTSATGATGEVAGGAARLVDPADEDEIAEGLADVLLDAELRSRLVSLGHDRVRDFSWDECARRTVDVLVTSVEGRGRSVRA